MKIHAYVDGLILVCFSVQKMRRWDQREYQKRAINKGNNKITFYAMYIAHFSRIH